MFKGVKISDQNIISEKPPVIIAIILTFNCEKLLEKAYHKIPKHLVNSIFVMDDGSNDKTIEIAESLGLKWFKNEKNLGYGGNIKAGLKHAFAQHADFVVEIHGDGAQFNPISIQHALPFLQSRHDLILGSRFIFPKRALNNGMPLLRYIANRFLSFFDRIVLQLPLTEFHSGFRIYSRFLFNQLPLEKTSNDFTFSFEVIAQAAYFNLNVGEVEVEADYHSEHSSHHLWGSFIYAIRTFKILILFLLAKYRIRFSELFPDRMDT